MDKLTSITNGFKSQKGASKMPKVIIYMFLTLALMLCLLSFSNTQPTLALDGGTWSNYTYDKDIIALAISGNTAWASTWGGLLRWDLTNKTYTKYTVVNGLPSDMISDVAVDGTGKVWVATDKGLSKLDGTTWTNYVPVLPTEFSGNQTCEEVQEIAITTANKIWFTCYMKNVFEYGPQGVTLFDPGTNTWTTYKKFNTPSLPSNDIRSLALDTTGNLWVGTLYGDISEFNGTSWTTYPDKNGDDSEIWAIAVDGANRKWFNSYAPDGYQVVVKEGATWYQYDPPAECKPFQNDVAIDSTGLAWFSVSEGGLCSFNRTTSAWTRYHTGNSGLLDNDTHELETKETKVYVGYALSWNGFSERDVNTWRHFDTTTNLPDDAGYAGMADRERTWFGGGHGVYAYDGVYWSAYTDGNSELADTCYYVFARDKIGHLWFAGGSCGGGLVEYDGETTWKQHYGSGVIDSFVYEIAIGEDNRVWAGWRQGLGVYDHTSWQSYTYTNMGYPTPTNMEHLAVDGDGNIWVNCLKSFNGTSWSTYSTKEQAIQNNYNAILHSFDDDVHCWLADSDHGRIWMEQTTRAGVKYYNGSTWTNISNATMGISGSGTSAYLEGWDRAGHLWVRIGDQYNHGGVSRFDGQTWMAYRAAHGVIEPPEEMTIEHNGRAWFGAFKGFSIYSNLMLPQKRTIYPTHSKSILSIDGSTSVDFPSGAVGDETTLTYTTTVASPIGDLLGIGHFFAMSAVISGTTTPVTFNKPFTVTVEYTEAESGGVDESTLGLYWWNGSAWQPASSTCDPFDNRVTATLDHLTKFAILGGKLHLYLPLLMR
jgi:ligand-binding sensor domain-containing protein